jgi:hypothetical protein
MKAKFMAMLALVAIFALQPAFAQKFKVKEGSLSAVKGVSKMNLVFDYSQMGVGKFKDEADYIDKKKGEYNKKESGKGDKWEKDWLADRTERYAPQFTELFNKSSDNIKVGEYANEKYTLVVKTLHTEPGFNIAITRKNAEIEGEILVVETGNPSNIVLRMTFEKAVGRSFGGYDYDTGFRIQEAYADLGKALGRYMDK